MRQNPLSFLFVLAAIAILPSMMTAQVVDDAVEVIEQEAQDFRLVAERKRIRRLTARGPHYKNPLAAGRVRTINQVARTKPAPVLSARVSRPAFKRQLRTRTSYRFSPPKLTERLYGPKYKNRRSSTRPNQG